MNFNKNTITVDKTNLISEWDYNKNERNPDEVNTSKKEKVWWICNNKHSWDERFSNRYYQKTGCPYCSGKRVLLETSLATLNPKLSEEWHPTENGELNPCDVRPGSNKKVWWLCSVCEEEWDAIISSRNKGNGCPYCAGKKVRKKESIYFLYPELIKEWDYEKNINITPYEVSSGSNRGIWWKCENGHSFQLTPYDRITEKINCRYCKSLEFLYPHIAKEWHPTKNGNLKPIDTWAKSSKKVWWYSEICGHEWETTVSNRTSDKKTNCTECSKYFKTSFQEQTIFYYCKKIFKDSLNRSKIQFKDKKEEADVFIPSLKLIIEYDGETHKTQYSIKKDYDKTKMFVEEKYKVIRIRQSNLPKLKVNENCLILIHDLEKNSFSLQQNIINIFSFILDEYKKQIDLKVKKQIVEMLEKIDIKKDEIDILNQYRDVMLESSLIKTHKELAKEWHPTLNKGLKPSAFTYGSDQKVWWLCPNGHSYEMSINKRAIRKTGCQHCKTLDFKFPDIAKEWHPTKNEDLTPKNVSYGSGKVVWWLCPEGHEYELRIDYRTNGNKGCTICNKQKIYTIEDMHKMAHSKNGECLSIHYKNVDLKLKWKCENGHIFEKTPWLVKQGYWCNECKKTKDKK